MIRGILKRIEGNSKSIEGCWGLPGVLQSALVNCHVALRGSGLHVSFPSRACENKVRSKLLSFNMKMLLLAHRYGVPKLYGMLCICRSFQGRPTHKLGRIQAREHKFMSCSQDYGPFWFQVLLRHLIYLGVRQWDPNFGNYPP